MECEAPHRRRSPHCCCCRLNGEEGRDATGRGNAAVTAHYLHRYSASLGTEVAGEDYRLAACRKLTIDTGSSSWTGKGGKRDKGKGNALLLVRWLKGAFEEERGEYCPARRTPPAFTIVVVVGRSRETRDERWKKGKRQGKFGCCKSHERV
nr:hypothetical protein Iba_scaffold29364CG0030 [Ipomoea batatas]